MPKAKDEEIKKLKAMIAVYSEVVDHYHVLYHAGTENYADKARKIIIGLQKMNDDEINDWNKKFSGVSVLKNYGRDK